MRQGGGLLSVALVALVVWVVVTGHGPEVVSDGVYWLTALGTWALEVIQPR